MDNKKDTPPTIKKGHKIRTDRQIVDRQQLTTQYSDVKAVRGQTVQKIHFEDQMGMMRVKQFQDPSEHIPNRFTGPSFRNKKERFRLDGHKMMYHLDRVQAWQKGERFSPIHIDMGLTKFCNTACIYCYAVVQNMTKGTLIPREPLLQFIKDCGKLKVKSIGFIGDGEPTLNPALYDAVVLAKSSGVDIGIGTNGILLDMDRAEDILRDATFMRINLSAGTKEGFRRVHQSSDRNFEMLVEKIRTLVTLKRKHNYPCTLGLQMVLIPECFDQVLKEAELGRELGVDYFVVKQCADSEYQELGIDYRDYQKVEKTLKEAEKLSTPHYNVQIKWAKINAAEETNLYKEGIRKYDICYGTPFLAQISGNGKVYPCGPFFNKERFYIGDITKSSFYDMVKGERYWQVHEDIVRSVDVHKDCAMGCRQDYLNKFLWDLKNAPEHINFI
ncbi:radical SAM protein [Magnetococcales bacterium HHB-1]